VHLEDEGPAPNYRGLRDECRALQFSQRGNGLWKSLRRRKLTIF
jgi:hypothetical protein